MWIPKNGNSRFQSASSTRNFSARPSKNIPQKFPARNWENSSIRKLPLIAAIAVFAVLAANYISRSKQESFFPRLGTPPVPQDKLEKILQASDSALQKNPKDSLALVNRGVAYFQMGPDHYADSLNALTEAWREGTFDKRIFYYLGVLYENLSVFDEAEKQYTRFLNHEPDDREILLRLARLDFRMGKWEESIQQYQKLLDKNPKDVTSLVNLGLAYQLRYKAEAALSGKNKKSDADLKKILELGVHNLEAAKTFDPNLSKGIYLALAQMYSAQGLTDQSIESAKMELTKYPGDNKDAYQVLTSGYEKLNNKQGLLETLEAWARSDPKNPNLPRRINALKKQLKIK